MASFLNPPAPAPAANPAMPGFTPLARAGTSMTGPCETNWVVRGQLLVGGHPGLLSQAALARNLECILGEDVNLFVCLQEELSDDGSHGSRINSTQAAGADLMRQRNAYGLRYMTACRPYMNDAKHIAARGRKDPSSLQFMHFPVSEANGAVAVDSDVTRCVQRVIAAMSAGDRVYMHCSDGNGRTGTVAALVLGVVYGLASSEALALAQAYRESRRGLQGGLAVESHQQRSQVHRLLSNPQWRQMVAATAPMPAAASGSRVGNTEQILREIQGGLTRRGPEAFVKLRRLLQKRDHRRSGMITLFDLTEALRSLGMGIRDGDVVKIVRQFDRDNSGAVDYHALLQAIRGMISPARKQTVRAAFDKIAGGRDQVTLLELKRHFCARKTDDVRSGRLSEEEAVAQFLDTFFNAGVTDKQIVTWEDFLEYYTNISAGYGTGGTADRAFELSMWDAWGMQGRQRDPSRPAGGSSTQRDPYTMQPGGPRHSHDGTQVDSKLQGDLRRFHGGGGGGGDDGVRRGSNNGGMGGRPQISGGGFVRLTPAETLDKIRDELLQKNRDAETGARTLTGGTNIKGVVNFVVALRGAALPNSGGHRITEQGFLQALREARGMSRAVTPQALRVLFDAFKPAADGTIGTGDVVDALCGQLSQGRRELVAQTFRKLDARGTGRVHVRDVAKAYVAKKHPEVVSARHTADEVFFAFFDGFRKLCASADGMVTMDMFEDYYRIVSSSFPDDDYFRILMWGVWELAGGSRIGHGVTHGFSSSIERAPLGAGRHKPGPAQRAMNLSVLSRSVHQQKIVDAAATKHHSSWAGSGGDTNAAVGIVPNASPSKHFQHQTRRGTNQAIMRTYNSGGVGNAIGVGAGGQAYWNQLQDQRAGGAAAGRRPAGVGGGGGAYYGAGEEDAPGDDDVAAHLRAGVLRSLQDRGVYGFVTLLRAFEGVDTQSSGNLPMDAFLAVLRQSGMSVTQPQVAALFRTLGLGSGSDDADQIDYGGFVNSLCGTTNESRRALIHQAFAKFDTNQNGFVPLEDLHSGYNASKHPDVTSGRRLAAQVHREFVDNFTVADHHGKVSIAAFEMYH